MRKKSVFFLMMLISLLITLTACSSNYKEVNQPASPTAFGGSDLTNNEFVIEPNESLSYIDFGNPGGYTNDFVPDAKTAYQVAMVYLYKQFDSESVDLQKPFHVSEDETLGLWMIRGTANMDKDQTGGGAINIVIRKKDGKVVLIAAEA